VSKVWEYTFVNMYSHLKWDATVNWDAAVNCVLLKKYESYGGEGWGLSQCWDLKMFPNYLEEFIFNILRTRQTKTGSQVPPAMADGFP